MKIVAFMPVFEEADILPYVIEHMREQGIEIHALEGWSTDGSYEILRDAGPGVTVERFPRTGKSPVQVCREILSRIECIAPGSGASWCYLSDCDEFRRSPRAKETLAAAIARVDASGYNVIDHRVFAFFNTDDGWRGDPEHYFRYYNEDDLICRIPNEKAWKNNCRVDLATHGGHMILRCSKRLCPERFVMKHYPFRTSVQGKRKLATRLSRRCEAEHENGWGVHYDEFPPKFPFIWDPAHLLRWNNLESPLP